MDIQRLRNLTTGRLHTQMGDIYEDIEFLTGEQGVMTHMLPRAVKAMEPWLRVRIPDERFWDDAYDPAHIGEFAIEPMFSDERADFWKRYGDMPSPLAGKEVIAVLAGQ